MNDPWKDISVPSVNGSLSARRADQNHKFDFFWAKDFFGNCALVFSYSSDISISDKRPKLQEITISDTPASQGRNNLSIVLKSKENKEIFLHLCNDIMQSTTDCSDEKAALAVLIRRTWRWHRMLKREAEKKLGPEAQKGLIGELWFLQNFLLTKYTPGEALGFWLGPEGAPKDFAIGNVSVEVKARRGGARPYVSISSEHQLDDSSEDQLYLFVLEVNPDAANSPDSFNLNQFVNGILAEIEQRDAGVVGPFEAKLMEAGYDEEHDYGDHTWIIGGSQFFLVGEGFPRICGSTLPSGIQGVAYKLEMKECQSFVAEADNFNEYLGETE